MIKLARLANKLDAEGLYEKSDMIDHIMSEIFILRKIIIF
jgi:hypothetical protein